MKIWHIFSIAFLLCGGYGTPAWADDGWNYPIRGNPDFADVHSQLQILVNIRGFHKINHFCIVADQPKSPADAEVYWATEGKLIAWEAQDNIFALVMSRDYVDLRHDVVANFKDKWKYMVVPWSRPEVNEVLNHCRRYGNSYTIIKSESGWVSIDKLPEFATMQAQLRTLVDQQAHYKENSFFCDRSKRRFLYCRIRLLAD